MRFSIMGVYLQNQSYLSCYIPQTIKLGTKLKTVYMPFDPMVSDANYLICIFMNTDENFKAVGKKKKTKT